VRVVSATGRRRSRIGRRSGGAYRSPEASAGVPCLRLKGEELALVLHIGRVSGRLGIAVADQDSVDHFSVQPDVAKQAAELICFGDVFLQPYLLAFHALAVVLAGLLAEATHRTPRVHRL